MYLLIDEKVFTKVYCMPDPWGYNTEQNWQVPTHSQVHIPSEWTWGIVGAGDRAWKKMQGTAVPRGVGHGG